MLSVPDDQAVLTIAPSGLDEWRLFAPQLDDAGAAYAALRSALSLPAESVLRALEDISRGSPDSGLFALRIKAATLLLRDLIEMGWEHRIDGHWILLRSPEGAGGPSKEAVRRQLEFGRTNQFREPSTKRFLIGLERPGRTSGCRPVTDLIADGRRLAAALAPIANMPPPRSSRRASGSLSAVHPTR